MNDELNHADVAHPATQGLRPYSENASPRRARLLSLLEMDTEYTRYRADSIFPALFDQMIVMRWFRDHGILTQICGNHFHVLKAAPPRNPSAETLDSFISALDPVLALVHSSTRFWQDALSLAARAARIHGPLAGPEWSSHAVARRRR